MFSKNRDGLETLEISIDAFIKHPSLIIPLLVVWLIYAPSILYFQYYFVWSDYSKFRQFLIVYLIIFCFAFLLSVSCLIVLELIQQIETTGKTNIFRALYDAIFRDLIETFPIIVAWSAVWFILSILQAIFSERRNRSKEYSAEAAVKTLLGVDDLSLSSAFFETLKKGVRMTVFLMLPAIAWEDKSFEEAYRRGVGIMRSHKKTFLLGFIISNSLAFIVYLPALTVIIVAGVFDLVFPDWIWYATMVYAAFAWSFSLLIEQLFTAELYLWHMNWENKNKTSGVFIPFENVKCPSLLNNKAELPAEVNKD